MSHTSPTNYYITKMMSPFPKLLFRLLNLAEGLYIFHLYLQAAQSANCHMYHFFGQSRTPMLTSIVSSRNARGRSIALIILSFSDSFLSLKKMKFWQKKSLQISSQQLKSLFSEGSTRQFENQDMTGALKSNVKCSKRSQQRNMK